MLIPPGSTIGILGGGQLGRMLAVAAGAMGYHCHIYDPAKELPAAEMAAGVTRAPYEDKQALAEFAAASDVITYEFENVPAEAVSFLSELKPVYPGAAALDVAQDRLSEKQFVNDAGGRTAPFQAVDSLDDLKRAVEALGTPAILKTRRMGYDGKGQTRIMSEADIDAAWEALGNSGPLILEGFISFTTEFSILMARGKDGKTLAYPPVENHHKDGILAQSLVPAKGLNASHVEKAIELTAELARKLQYVGILTAEFFETSDGPILNEIAPRVHNSGHWTIEGAETSQFEQHIRAVCGLPFGSVALTAKNVAMENLLGNDVYKWPDILSEEGAHLHIYGKSEVRAGRKMGHVTRVER